MRRCIEWPNVDRAVDRTSFREAVPLPASGIQGCCPCLRRCAQMRQARKGRRREPARSTREAVQRQVILGRGDYDYWQHATPAQVVLYVFGSAVFLLACSLAFHAGRWLVGRVFPNVQAGGYDAAVSGFALLLAVAAIIAAARGYRPPVPSTLMQAVLGRGQCSGPVDHRPGAVGSRGATRLVSGRNAPRDCSCHDVAGRGARRRARVLLGTRPGASTRTNTGS